MNKQTFLSLLLAVAICITCLSVSFALLFDNTSQVKNIFTKANVDILIEEDFDNVTKENVTITSQSDIPIYLRLKLVCSLEDSQGNTLTKQVSINDFNIIGFNSANWVIIDNVYYYKYIVNPNEKIKVFDSATVKTQYENGEIPVMTVLAEGIQSNVASEQWEITILNGEIVKGES